MKVKRLFGADCNPKQLSPVSLAFVGDGVFELFVREKLVCQGNCPVNAPVSYTHLDVYKRQAGRRGGLEPRF